MITTTPTFFISFVMVPTSKSPSGMLYASDLLTQQWGVVVLGASTWPFLL